MGKKLFVGDPGFDVDDPVRQHVSALHGAVASTAVNMERLTKPDATLDALKNGPVLNLSEENGKFHAGVGAGSTIAAHGKTITPPESSPRRLGPDGKRMWSAP